MGFIYHDSAYFVTLTVHPHVRGVYVKHLMMLLSRSGSSPRAWGLYANAALPICAPRFIPTCVGFMDLEAAMKAKPYGSSPRAWGLCFHLDHLRHNLRFIPTCVGFMPYRIGSQVSRSVHPHVRGVYFFRAPHRRRRLGSSPRAWGL